MRKQKGFSLVEVILVVAVVVFIALLIATLPPAVSSINKSRQLSIAKDIAGKQIEYLRGLDFQNNLPLGTNSFSSPDLSALPSSEAGFETSQCPPEICTLGEESKVVRVWVTWKETGDDKKVELSTLISKGGLAQ